MPNHAHGHIPMPKVFPHTTLRAKKRRVRVVFPDVGDLLFTAEEAYALADALVDTAEALPPETPTTSP